MKKSTLLFIVAMMLFTTALAQESKHEVRVGYGLVSSNMVIDAFSDFLATGLTAGYYTSKNKSFTGAFNLGYKYAISDVAHLGGTFAYEKGSSDAYYNWGVKGGKFRNEYFTIAPELDVEYFKTDLLSVYALAGVGGTFTTRNYTSNEGEKEDESTLYFNFQVTPVGVKVGKSVGVFGEFGFGYKGLLNLGLFAKF